MDFRDLAAKETSALVGRLFAKSAETSRQRLAAFRTAIDGATKALDAALAAPGSPAQIEREVTDLVTRLTKAAAAETEAAQDLAEEARAAADGLRSELKTIQQEKSVLQRELEGVRRELAAVNEDCKTYEVERLEAVAALEEETRARGAAEDQVRTLRRQVETMRAEGATIVTDLKTATADRAKLEKALAAAQSQTKVVETKLTAVNAQLDANMARIKALEDIEEENERALHQAETKLHDAETRLHQTEAKLRDADVRLKTAAAAEAKLKALTTELNASTARVKALEAAEPDYRRALNELDDTRRTVKDLEARLKELDDAKRAVKELEGKLKTAAATESKLATVSAQLVASSARVKALEGAEQEHKRALKDLETKATVAASAGASAAGRHEAAVSTFDRLLGGFQNLVGASNVSDALSRMLQCLASDYPRVALFRVKGNRLEGEQQIGFDHNTDITKVVIPLGLDSMLTRAAASGRIEQLTGEELAARSGALFAGDSRPALAMPIIVHGETLAIVYADSGKDAQGLYDPLKAKFAEAVLHHTVSVLLRLSSELKVFSELRTYATSLLDELDEMYQADVSAQKPAKELVARLKANLECARTIFQTRVETECPEAAPIFDEQLAAAIEAKRGTSYGDHLMTASGRTESAGKRKAEAS